MSDIVDGFVVTGEPTYLSSKQVHHIICMSKNFLPKNEPSSL